MRQLVVDELRNSAMEPSARELTLLRRGSSPVATDLDNAGRPDSGTSLHHAAPYVASPSARPVHFSLQDVWRSGGRTSPGSRSRSASQTSRASVNADSASSRGGSLGSPGYRYFQA